MKITGVTLPVLAVDDWLAFLGGTLELEVRGGSSAPAVRAGWTTMTLRAESCQRSESGQRSETGRGGSHHLAFTIPEARFEAAKVWLRSRTPLLTLDGADEFETSPAWNAHSLYFAGPDGSVLEFIARRDLPHGTAGDFSSDDVVCVSEVGIAVDDVQTAARSLALDAGIEPYSSAPGPDFAPLGTADGLLILVGEGRAWFPTSDRVAGSGTIHVHASAPRAGRFALGTAVLTVTAPA